ncbi:MAG: 3-hydroxyacyl-CoA dehydrogenase NAD-binding domain-containing protein, partial [Dehalococcoidia bacterium]
RRIVVRVGRYGPFLERGAERATIPDGVAPDELDVAMAEELLDRAQDGIARRLGRDVERGRLTFEERKETLGRIDTHADWEGLSGLSEADVTIEAIVEDLDAKAGVFRTLGAVCKPTALLASNTSSLPLSDLAAASGRPERVVGLHFFNPPWALKLVEVVETASTTEETLAEALEVCEDLDRAPVRVQDTPGFIANRLLVPFIFDAIRLLQNGTATAEDIDSACRLGLNHAMGPLATADLVGLDVLIHISASMFDEYGEPRFKAPTLLRRLVALNHLGRKTGRGFFSYGR